MTPRRRRRRATGRPRPPARARIAGALLVATLLLGVGAVAGQRGQGGAGAPPAAASLPAPPARAQPSREAGPPAPAQPQRRAQPPGRRAVPPAPRAAPPRRARRLPRWTRPSYPDRPSLARGTPSAGRLVRGVRLPAAGPHHRTWDPILRRRPNRAWRRWGTDRLVRRVLQVARAYRRRHPSAPRVLVGDLSRPRGGGFGPRYGRIGHASHQNGLDVDVYLPRRDGRARAPRGPGDVHRALAQALVDRFVAAGARLVFVGPSLGLTGPPGVVQELAGHDDHLHVRLPAR